MIVSLILRCCCKGGMGVLSVDSTSSFALPQQHRKNLCNLSFSKDFSVQDQLIPEEIILILY